MDFIVGLFMLLVAAFGPGGSIYDLVDRTPVGEIMRSGGIMIADIARIGGVYDYRDGDIAGLRPGIRVFDPGVQASPDVMRGGIRGWHRGY